MTDIELTKEMIKRADDFVEKEKREFAIGELEKIKAEIMATGKWEREYEISNNGIKEVLQIIDNHISKLKGESNEP